MHKKLQTSHQTWSTTLCASNNPDLKLIYSLNTGLTRHQCSEVTANDDHMTIHKFYCDYHYH